MELLLLFKWHSKSHITQETESSNYGENNTTKISFLFLQQLNYHHFPNRTCFQNFPYAICIVQNVFFLLPLCLLSSYLSFKTQFKWSSSWWSFHWLWPGFHCPMLVNVLTRLWEGIIVICSDGWEPHRAENIQISSSPKARSRPKTLLSKHNSTLTNLFTHSNLSGIGSRLYKYLQLENQIRHNLRFVKRIFVNHCSS